jgi:hypothetical protein
MLRTSSLRTSGFLAIALSASALISVTVPASAGPSKVFGSVQSSQEASQVLGLKKVEKLEQPLPKTPATERTSVGNLREPIPQTKVIPSPPWPPHCEAGGSACKPLPLPPCGLNGSLCKDGKKDDDRDEHHRPVVIFAPQVPVQVPVYVPGPYASPRVVTGVSSVPAVRQQPVIMPHCMTAADVPQLAAGIDQLLPTAKLSEADMTQVTELRQTIQLLATDGKVPAARDTEEIAMNILGYQKVWLRCGQGVFDWEPLPVPTQAQATQAR